MGWLMGRPESRHAQQSGRRNASWCSPSDGTWKFKSDVVSVTWQMKSQNIYFEGEKSEEMSKRIISLINQYMNTSFNQGKVSDA